MLGPTKWRLLTIVAGILLAHAIDSPVRSPRILRSFDRGISIERFVPWNDHFSRNLYTPYERFSNVDNVRVVESNSRSNVRSARKVIGALRYTNSNNDMSRRSDEPTSLINNNTMYESMATSSPRTRSPRKMSAHKYIPISLINDPLVNVNNSTERIQSRTDTTYYTNEDDTRSKITFPGSSTSDITGRRSGIKFSSQSQKYGNPFIPQGYREDNPNHPNFQSPYSEELFPAEPDVRYTRGITFDSSSSGSSISSSSSSSSVSNIKQRSENIGQQTHQQLSQQFRDDVTKFGDINGPITSSIVQRQFSEFVDRPFVRPFDGGYFSSSEDYGRQSRPYFPPKSYVEYSDYPGPPRNRLLTSWKSSRTPRVVFPQGDALPTGPSDNNYSNDNIVFR